MPQYIHPGVSLWQKVQGGTFYLCWRDPREHRRQRKDSSETNDYDEASRVAMGLSRILRNADYWLNPPDDVHPRALTIWGVVPIGEKVKRAKRTLKDINLRSGLQNELYLEVAQLVANKHFGGIRVRDPKDAAKVVQDLLDSHEPVLKERDALRVENRRLTGLLKKMGLKSLVSTEPKAMVEAVEDYFASPSATSAKGQWRGILRNWCDRFAREVGEKKDVHHVSPVMLIDHVNALDVGNGTKKKLIYNLCAFLNWASNENFDDREAKDFLDTLEEESSEWFWLSREQSLGIIGELKKQADGQFWADAALLQYGRGFRPEEMPLLQSGRVRLSDGSAAISIARIFDEEKNLVRHLKTTASADTVRVPSFAFEAVERRLAAEHFLLFPLVDDSILPPRMRTRTRFERDNKFWPSADDHIFSNVYCPRLRTAAKAHGIPPKKVDSRTFRRTCAREMILAYGYEQAAAVLRDSVATLRRHYADLEAADVSTER